MSDAHETGSSSDVVAVAARYRDRLIAEIEKVESFLKTAGELCTFEGEDASDLWPVNETGASRTIH